MHNPHGSLTIYQGGLARLVAIQLGIPSEQCPVAELTAKHKNDTLAAIEHKCSVGGSSWKLMVQKWKGFAAPQQTCGCSAERVLRPSLSQCGAQASSGNCYDVSSKAAGLYSVVNGRVELSDV
jgi:hypothetical protein